MLGAVGLVGVGAVGAVGGYLWVTSVRDARLAAVYEVPDASFPIPFPLSEGEVEALRAERLAALAAEGRTPEELATIDPLAGLDLAAIAAERAVARGKRLVESRYPCVECHGRDFGGGVMIVDAMIGGWRGPNLTLGSGSVTTAYEAADWSRMIRHGVKPSGHPTVMPSTDFLRMSDHEISDIVSYVRSMPPVDATVPPVTYGPLGSLLVANGTVRLTAEEIPDHAAPHAVEPPPESDTLAFGRHISQPCSGCHGATFAGGTIPGGPPDWPAAANLTPHADGLAGWTREDFVNAVKGGRSRNGAALQVPMIGVLTYAQQMSDVEMDAMWAFFQSLEAKPDPN
jgi:mono/diheme cytochrome c family protein